MSNWRPEGWKSLAFQKGMEAKRWSQLSLGECFEAGADAMLEAVCEEVEKTGESLYPWKILALLRSKPK